MLFEGLRLGVVAITMVTGSHVAVAAPHESPDAKLFQTLGWTTVNSVEAIQPTVLAALQSRFGSDSRLANPGEPFDATDVVTGKPRRRLLLAGHATTRWFVAYERGGRGHYLVLVIFDSGAKVPEPTLLARGTAGAHDDQAGWRVSLAELRAALKDGTLSQDDVHEPYY